MALRTPGLLEWLYVVWTVRRIQKRLTFSKRVAFYKALRPRFDDYPVDRTLCVEWPDAFVLLTMTDLDRALAAVENIEDVT